MSISSRIDRRWIDTPMAFNIRTPNAISDVSPRPISGAKAIHPRPLFNASHQYMLSPRLAPHSAPGAVMDRNTAGNSAGSAIGSSRIIAILRWMSSPSRRKSSRIDLAVAASPPSRGSSSAASYDGRHAPNNVAKNPVGGLSKKGMD
jgi:hypothetical protein